MRGVTNLIIFQALENSKGEIIIYRVRRHHKKKMQYKNESSIIDRIENENKMK